MTDLAETARLGLAYLQERQAMKHVTLNEALKRLDVLVQAVAVSRAVSVQPPSAEEGSVFILPETRSGSDWGAMQVNALACYVDGVWFEILPAIGWSVYVMDENMQVFFTGEGWTGAAVDSPCILGEQLGVNTIADTTNRLSVKSDAVLFSHDDQTPGSGDIRLTLNKADTASSSSLIFSQDYEGYFEIGFGGSNDLTIRRSTDGVSYADCLGVSRVTGELTLANNGGLSFRSSQFSAAPPFRMVAEGELLPVLRTPS